MRLNEIGERKLTYFITEKFGIPFDDAAFIEWDGEYIVATTDMVGRKTHFPHSATFFQMGWYAMAVNMSDLAAKGAEPFAYLVAISMPADLEEKNYRELMRGMEECTKKYGGRIVGGDTKEADDIIIAVTALGKVKAGREMRRLGARAGDAVYVTGSIGKGGAALLDEDTEKLLMIEPRIKEGRILSLSGAITSCMDLSDGLASSLHQLAFINKVGFRIYEDALPVDYTARKHKNWLELALYYGGDYELLFTASQNIKDIERRIDAKRIGEVIEERKVVLVKDGKEYEIENRGYEHFVGNK
ncbi:MAG: thiamine-phosphate kinase [Thermoplasmata archaeon]|nr:thiamine-phosphate kinase [Thermoplasmata archaeon]